mmetsp:Transcript_34359/g.51867  ORF Transcript_34359/g.51867 Transcript_34359/m.51867 type:complete len:355 (-) Transcript_34359:345-1409(-)
MVNEDKLFRLLDLDDLQEEKQNLDCDTIIKEVYGTSLCKEIMCTSSHGFSNACCPLHKAIVLKAPLHVIDTLCSSIALPTSVSKFNTLHLAFMCGSSCDIVRFLLQKWPDVTRGTNGVGFTPLQLACQLAAPLDVVCLLLDSWPDAIRMKDNFGYTPLHWACRYGAPLDVISLLVSVWPDAISAKGAFGFSPLHWACTYGAPYDVVSLLLERCPDAAREKTIHGCTPLHCVLQGDFAPPLEVVILLLEKWPGATKERDNRGKTPFVHAQENDIPEDIQKHIFLTSIISDDGIDIASLRDIMSFLMDSGWWEGVTLVLERYPALIETLNIHADVMADYHSGALLQSENKVGSDIA